MHMDTNTNMIQSQHLCTNPLHLSTKRVQSLRPVLQISTPQHHIVTMFHTPRYYHDQMRSSKTVTKDNHQWRCEDGQLPIMRSYIIIEPETMRRFRLHLWRISISYILTSSPNLFTCFWMPFLDATCSHMLPHARSHVVSFQDIRSYWSHSNRLQGPSSRTRSTKLRNDMTQKPDKHKMICVYTPAPFFSIPNFR